MYAPGGRACSFRPSRVSVLAGPGVQGRDVFSCQQRRHSSTAQRSASHLIACALQHVDWVGYETSTCPSLPFFHFSRGSYFPVAVVLPLLFLVSFLFSSFLNLLSRSSRRLLSLSWLGRLISLGVLPKGSTCLAQHQDSLIVFARNTKMPGAGRRPGGWPA